MQCTLNKYDKITNFNSLIEQGRKRKTNREDVERHVKSLDRKEMKNWLRKTEKEIGK